MSLSVSADSRRVRVGLAWAFVAVALWSLSLPLTKAALGGFDVFVVAAGRGVVAGVLAVIVLCVLRRPFPKRDLWRPLAWTAMGAVFGWPLLIALALQYTTSVHAAVITSVMPLVTAILAVAIGGERVRRSFWWASGLGTATLVVFALSRGGLTGGGVGVDALLILAVFSSSWSYVFGAAAARRMPGWEVISWVSALSLPLTMPITAVAWWTTRNHFSPDVGEWSSLIMLGVTSAYVGFFAWYRGLALAGTAYGGQVQQLQSLMAIAWSAILLREAVTWEMVATTCIVIIAVVWAQRSRIRSDGTIHGTDDRLQ